jgi:D-glycero-alpha-D-manno-heptose-7-phosphate kinase
MEYYNKDNFLISESSSIKEALVKIELNALGFIMTFDQNSKIVGLATDGDIRRALLNGISLKDTISKCTNSDFIRASKDTPRENLIKQLDNKIHFIPLLDDDDLLVSIATRDHLPLRKEEAIYIRSRAPVRVSFGGGGSDLTHYFSDASGAVVNAAISIYSHATMRVRDDLKITIESFDLNKTIKAENLKEILKNKEELGLIKSVLKVVDPKFGFDLYLNSDFQIGSGLGGSATVCAAILGCFNILRQDQWDNYELAEIAFEAERLHLGIAGGWQDQYAAVFGGFNFIEFGMDQNVIHPIRLNKEIQMELEESLVLCSTGISHDSGNIHKNQKETMSSELIKIQVGKNVDLAYKTRNLLLRGRLSEFGKCLDSAWKLKRNFSEMISNDRIDSIYDGALKNGAIGGKLLGAGGGGFFIFYVPPFKKFNLIDYLVSQDLEIQPFRFEPEGLQYWASRENKTTKLFKEI